MSDGENVKVAVRVRPFNSREKARNATLIVKMANSSTYLTDPDNPNEEPRSFSFDFSYWSHDGCKDEANGFIAADTKHPNGKIFADQKRVFDDLGQGILKNAWEGFNSTLFAYGQTGSGKSWSIVGYGVNKGVVPQFCNKMFVGIDEKKKAGDATEFEVTFSMLEIYNENVRDLLNPSTKKSGLRVRQHPKKGFYAENLTYAAVDSYAEIEQKMDEGTTNRTVAATNMNATSSRAHTIVGISFVQKGKNAAGQETAKTSIINLVDLAGSERADSTGATGDRLKEGAAINQSLSSLGNVISALADRSKGKNVKVPFRDSVLTKLLKNALGGNSKTIMIAAISPADINYEETLSTLRYADRAKQIKTVAKVNEDPTEKLIRELQEENEKLKKMLETGQVVLPSGTGEDGIEAEEGMSEADKAELKKELEEEYQAQLEDNRKAMEEMEKSFAEKLAAARESGTTVALSETAEKKKTVAHIYNLNFDPQLSGKIIHFVEGTKKVGTKKGENVDILLVGPSMQPNHALLIDEGGKFYIDKAGEGRILCNGEPVTQKTELSHNDRVMFGTTQLYMFCNPKQRDAAKTPFPVFTFEKAQEEIAANAGFDMDTENKSRDDMLLQEDLMEMMPAVEEANSISEDLDKKKKFELMMVSAEARGELKGRAQVMVKVIDLETGLEWVWTKEKFLNRKFVMQEMFEKFEDGEDASLPVDRDPFVEDPNADVHIGSVKVWLQSAAYNIELKEQLEITDFKGTEVGLLNVEIVPCNKSGKEYTDQDDVWVDNPDDLVGRDLYYVVKINSARGLPSKYTDIYAKYLFYLDTDYHKTNVVKDTSNPDWKHKNVITQTSVTQQFIKYLNLDAVMIQVWGKQKPPKTKRTVNTRDVLQKQSLAKGHVPAANSNTKLVDAGKVKLSLELAMMKKKQERLELKVAQFKRMVEMAEQHKKAKLSIKIIKGVLLAPTQDAAEKCFKLIPKEKDGGAVADVSDSEHSLTSDSDFESDGSDKSDKEARRAKKALKKARKSKKGDNKSAQTPQE